MNRLLVVKGRNPTLVDRLVRNGHVVVINCIVARASRRGPVGRSKSFANKLQAPLRVAHHVLHVRLQVEGG